MRTMTDVRPGADWSDELKADLARNALNGAVGHELVSETDRVRVWLLRLAPGERIGFHRHVLDYFWTVMGDGKARSHYGDGSTADTTYRAGDTRHMRFGPGEFMVHDLINIGDTTLVFTTVEFLDSANEPLPIAPELRRAA